MTACERSNNGWGTLRHHWYFRTVIAAALLMPIVACTSKEPQMVDPKDLETIKLGEVVHLSELLKQPAHAVCVLTPYRDRLDENEPLSGQINSYLTTKNLTLYEGEWALVFVNGDNVSVQIFSRQQHYMVSRHEGVPKNFKPVDCTSVGRALVTKVLNLWPALIIGEER